MDSPVDLLLKLRGIERLAYHLGLPPVAQSQSSANEAFRGRALNSKVPEREQAPWFVGVRL
jgi:hypothetical protein